jgi:hypothetical protein
MLKEMINDAIKMRHDWMGAFIGGSFLTLILAVVGGIMWAFAFAISWALGIPLEASFWIVLGLILLGVWAANARERANTKEAE